MIVDVGDRRQVAERRLARREQRRRHQLQHAVLGADDLDLAGQARAAGHSQNLHAGRLAWRAAPGDKRLTAHLAQVRQGCMAIQFRLATMLTEPKCTGLFASLCAELVMAWTILS